MHQLSEIASASPGVSATVGISGQSLLLNAYGSNFGTMFVTLNEFKKRPSPSPLARASRTGSGSTWGSNRNRTPPISTTKQS